MALTSRPFAANVEAELEGFTRVATSRESVRSRIIEAGLIPSVRTTSEDDLLFAAGALVESGVSILEISSTFPGFLNLIECACQEFPDLIVGAGNLFDAKMARRSLDAGAKFLTSDGLVLEVVEIAIEREVVVLPGALTPKEVIDAWKTGAEFVKITPCDAMGGEIYMRTLKVAFPQIRFVASGGITQQNVSGYIQAGATAVAVGKDMIPIEAIRLRQKQRIQEMVRRFLTSIDSARG